MSFCVLLCALKALRDCSVSRRKIRYSRPETLSSLFEREFFKRLFIVSLKLRDTLVRIDFNRKSRACFEHDAFGSFFGNNLSLAAQSQFLAEHFRKRQRPPLVDVDDISH